METSHRAMTARERAELESLVSIPTSALRSGLFLVAVGSAGYVFRAILTSLFRAAPGIAVAAAWVAPTLGLALLLYVWGGRWTGGREFRRTVRRDLQRGEIAVRQIHVVEALEAPEIEDEGPVFFLLDADGTTLFFAGQEMAREKARGFPWVEFEISESPDSNHFFRLKPCSGSFDNVEVRTSLDFSEAKALGVLSAKYGVLEVRLDDLRNEA